MDTRFNLPESTLANLLAYGVSIGELLKVFELFEVLHVKRFFLCQWIINLCGGSFLLFTRALDNLLY